MRATAMLFCNCPTAADSAAASALSSTISERMRQASMAPPVFAYTGQVCVPPLRAATPRCAFASTSASASRSLRRRATSAESFPDSST